MEVRQNVIIECVNFQTDCTVSLKEKAGENFVLAATLDMWNEFRMKKNMSDMMKYKEKAKDTVNYSLDNINF